jgi:hypothetical protein
VWIASLLAAARAAADPGPCVSATGYALVGMHSNANYGGDVTWLFTPPGGSDVFCDPPHSGRVQVGGSRGSVIVEYLAGTGVAFATGSIANPSATSANRGHVQLNLFLEFTAVPDDPGATDAIPVVLRARHDFAGVATSVSGSGTAFNSHEGFYQVLRGSTAGQLVDSWDSDGLVMTGGGRFDFVRPIEVLPNVPHVLSALLFQESYARGTLGSTQGSAAAEASSTVTFQVDTEAAASVVWEVENAFGVPPPQLGVVAVPEAGALTPAAVSALVGLWSATRRRAGSGVACPSTHSRS